MRILCNRTIFTRIFIVSLFLLGILHWLSFFYLVSPPGGDRDFLALQQPPVRWFEGRVFNAHDWYKEVQYQKIVKDSLINGVLPLHVPNLGKMFMIKERFMGALIWTMSPQIILLYLLDPFTFAVINLLIMYSIGFYGCMLIRKHYQLGLIPFIFIFILFNFNGYFVEKITAYGPGQMGYFLLPFLILLMLQAAEPKYSKNIKRNYLGLLMGIVLAGMLYQGSFHLFVECITFVLIWGIVNFKLWKVTIFSLAVAFMTSAMRLFPAVITFGHGSNPNWQNYGQYLYPWNFLIALVVTKTHLSKPYFSWWEYSLYIGWIGLAALIYFGVWSNYKKREWAKFNGWGAMAVPCFLMVILSFQRLKQCLIPNFIPLLNGESNPMRYMIIPLVIVIVIAAINMSGFIEKSRKVKRIKYSLYGALLIMAAFIFNHSRLWRLHRVQNEFNRVTANRMWGEKPSPQIVLSIANNMSDTLYIYSFWVGLVISIVAFILVLWWLISNRKKLRS